MDNALTRWDKPEAAEEIDAYWRNSPDEGGHRQRLAALVHEQMETDGETLLEVGCGTGLVYSALRDEIGGRPPRYTGLDSSKRMLHIAGQRHVTALLVDGDAETLDFPDAYFDHAFAAEVFGHMADCTKALGELLRVARKTAIFTLWVKDGLTSPLEGEDHYEYPTGWADLAVFRCQPPGQWYTVDTRPMPW
ncbi:MAG: class I SAM-dependent methyltransferase, partial [Dehalococcoidia bacterium]|nr:class I SAM-dependent methyltransferase [Dehalococcoidia bacterium]